MFVWGPGIYENDEVMDWIYDLLESGSLRQVKFALELINQDPLALEEIADCQIALAAADLIASLEGEGNPDMPEEAEDWVSNVNLSTKGMRPLAEDTVKKIEEKSALKESMIDKEMINEWTQIVKELLLRLE